jgi:uncharacterized protein YcbK (DUF882 family)
MNIEEKIKSFYAGTLDILKPHEIYCKCYKCDRTQEVMDSKIIAAFIMLREQIGEPITIKSGFRCPQHNRFCNGASNSMHMSGSALDLMPKNYNIDEFYSLCLAIPTINGLGKGKYFVHIDCRYGERTQWTY